MPSPNPGYAITIRVQAPAASAMIGDLTSAIGKAGGSGHRARRRRVPRRPDRRRRHLATPRTPTHVDVITDAIGALDGFVVRKVSDRTFLMHLGGKIEVTPEGAAAAPRRPLPRLHPRRRPGLPGDREEPRGRAPAHHQAQHRRRRHRRVGGARPGQHRARRGAAGDGGQGRAVQAVRGRRRVAGLPRHAGHRRDRRDRARDGAGVRRDQPRGHRRAALLRDRGAGCASCSTSRCSTTTSTAPPSSSSPR